MANREWEVFQPHGKAEVADSATVNEVQMVAKALAGGASLCAEDFVQCTAVERVCLDAENSSDDVGAVIDEGGVLGDRVDKLHGATVDTTENSQRRNVELQEHLDEKFCWKLVELAIGITHGDRPVSMSPIVKRTSCLELRIVQGVVADVLLRIHGEIGQITEVVLHRSAF